MRLPFAFSSRESNRSPSTRRRFSRAGWLALSGLLPIAAGCDLAAGFQDLGDSLVDPDAALLDAPGRKLVAGRYSTLVLDGSLEKGGFVLAFRHDTPEQRLAIVPFLEGDDCEVKDAVAFERVSSRVDVALTGLVAVQTSREESGRGKIRFVGFDCEDRMEALEDATMPRIEFPSSTPRGLLTLTGDRKLYLADADHARLDLVAENVSQAIVAENQIWSLEDGVLVMRDADLQVIDRIGEDVTEYSPTYGEDPTVVFRDASGLKVWGPDDGEELLAEDGCAAVPLDASTIAYFSPCEERRLVLSLRGSKIGSDESRVTLLGPANVKNHGQMLASFGMNDEISRFVFTTSDDPSGVNGSLLVAELDPETLPEDPEIELELAEISGDAALVNGNVFEEWNGTSGRLMELDKNEEGRVQGLRLVAEGVAQVPGGTAFSGRGLLVRYDGSTGDLVELEQDGDAIEETRLARRVPVQTQVIESDTGLVAFVGDLSGTAGKVYLLEDGATTAVAEEAFPNTLRFLEQPRAVAFLAPNGRNGTKLSAYLLEAGLEQTIHEGAAEYRIVPWPSPGILYSIPEGEDRGLWFSKAR